MIDKKKVLEVKEVTQPLLDQSGLVCTISKEEEEERVPNISFLKENVIEIEELTHGYSVVFPYNPEIAHSLLDFVVKEHKCCPFFPFDISFRKQDQKIKLKVETENYQHGENIGKIIKTLFEI